MLHRAHQRLIQARTDAENGLSSRLRERFSRLLTQLRELNESCFSTLTQPHQRIAWAAIGSAVPASRLARELVRKFGHPNFKSNYNHQFGRCPDRMDQCSPNPKARSA